MTMRTGGCMCGAIRFEAEATGRFAVCYCKMCQRWASGVFMSAQTTGFAVTSGAEALKVVRTSDWASRAFCRECGSNIYYDADGQDHPNVALGALDDTDGLRPAIQWYIDKKPAALPELHDVKAMTEAEVIELFGGENG